MSSRNELIRYINHLHDVIDAMSSDLEKVCKLADIEISADCITEKYSRVAAGPTILETVLIKQGSLTEEDAKRNSFSEMLIRQLQMRLAQTEPNSIDKEILQDG